jgi:hypothetical protein
VVALAICRGDGLPRLAAKTNAASKKNTTETSISPEGENSGTPEYVVVVVVELEAWLVLLSALEEVDVVTVQVQVETSVVYTVLVVVTVRVVGMVVVVGSVVVEMTTDVV